MAVSDAVALLMASLLWMSSTRLGYVYGAMAFLLLALAGSHRARINPRLADEAGSLVAKLSVPVVLTLPFVQSGAQLHGLARIAPTGMGLVIAGRIATYSLLRRVRARRSLTERTVIVGAGKLGVRLSYALREHPEFGLSPVGFLDSFDDLDLPLPILGRVQDLPSVIDLYGIRRVIVAFGGTPEPELVKVLRSCSELPVEIHVLPRFFELGVAEDGPVTEDLWGIRLVPLWRSPRKPSAWRVKRLLDISISSVLLALSAPLLLVITVAVRLSSPGPVFFRQVRLGRAGHAFELIKFRTMREHDDSDITWSVSNDDRVTKIGLLLRRTGLDELPQLINVIKGDMALVGPRPERPYFVDQFKDSIPGYRDRHRVPAGITGWAQVHGLRGDTSIEDRAAFDNDYIEHWSLWKDLVILGRTAFEVVKGRGS